MQKAKETCRDLRQDVKVETKVVNRDPKDVICQMAEQLRADVVVVGSQRLQRILHLLPQHCARQPLQPGVPQPNRESN
ncbi:hypothetical protein ACFX2G_034451 [Malus domestica]